MHVHLVFVTKYRRGVFSKEILEDLHEIFASVCHDFEATLVEFDGEDDHVHLRVHYPPKVSVSALVNSLKGVSSRLIRKKKIPSSSEKTLGRIALVPQLFCRKLWGSPYLCDSTIHRTAEDATLKATTGTAMPSALSFPALQGEGCRAIGSTGIHFPP